jgi:FkbM family methyltransferase
MPRTGAFLHHAIVRRLPDVVDVTLVQGVETTLHLDQPVELQSWWQGHRYEHPTTEVLDTWSRQATRFFDVGANYGFFSLRAVANGCPDVHAFEPNPALHRRLEETATRNGLRGLHPHHLGLADAVSTLELNVGGDFGHSSFGPRAWDDKQTVPVGVVPFDRWRVEAGITLPDRPEWAVKIDVEGFELNVLRGMSETLSAHAFFGVSIELNELTLQSCGVTGDDIVAFLATTGYHECRDRAGEPGLANAFFAPT